MSLEHRRPKVPPNREAASRADRYAAVGRFLLEFESLAEVRVLGAYLLLGAPADVSWNQIRAAIAEVRSEGKPTNPSTVGRGLQGLARRRTIRRQEVVSGRYLTSLGESVAALLADGSYEA